MSQLPCTKVFLAVCVLPHSTFVLTPCTSSLLPGLPSSPSFSPQSLHRLTSGQEPLPLPSHTQMAQIVCQPVHCGGQGLQVRASCHMLLNQGRAKTFLSQTPPAVSANTAGTRAKASRAVPPHTETLSDRKMTQAARVPDIKLQKPRPTSLAETKYTPPSRVKLPLHSSLIHLTFIRTGEKRENANQISGVHNALAVPEQKSDRLSNLTRHAADRRREQERESCHRDMQPHSRGHIHNVELSGPSTSQRSPLHHKFQHKPFCHQHAEFCRASEFYIKPRMQKGTGESPCK
ncbi:hypothetical protein QQF64_003964 [Cirrhinus molitorella]|uniref:Uncharacterized protein n=1 Tax=Cirrhinus molitorella TaxID=172907 RepID=A0ABR3MMS7_9TELE